MSTCASTPAVSPAPTAALSRWRDDAGAARVPTRQVGGASMADDASHHVELASRRIPLPAALSEAARAMLAMPRPAMGAYPKQTDKEGWRRLIASRNKASAE